MQTCQTTRAATAARAGPAAVAAATPWHGLQHICQSSAACCASSSTSASVIMHTSVSRAPASPSRLQQQQQCKPLQQQQEQQRRGRLSPVCAGPIDSAPVWTLDQIAGLVFGAVMLAFYFSSSYVDVYIARQQRKQLGLCERCGGLNDAATCSQAGCPMKSKAAQ